MSSRSRSEKRADIAKFIFLFLLWFAIVPTVLRYAGVGKMWILFISNLAAVCVGFDFTSSQMHDSTFGGILLSVILGVPAMIITSRLSFILVKLAGYSTTTNAQAIGKLAKINPALLIVTSCLIGPLAEELIFRGSLFRTVKDWWGTAPAYIISSLVFGLMHCTTITSPKELVMVIPYALSGLILAFIYDRKGLQASMAAHVVNNTITMFI